MDTPEFTITDLRRILRDAAGEVEPTGDILDVLWDELGYDSLALLETARRIETEHLIRLADTAIIDAATPRALLDLVNEQLAADQAA